jgi:hypothetical protein
MKPDRLDRDIQSPFADPTRKADDPSCETLLPSRHDHEDLSVELRLTRWAGKATLTEAKEWGSSVSKSCRIRRALLGLGSRFAAFGSEVVIVPSTGDQTSTGSR